VVGETPVIGEVVITRVAACISSILLGSMMKKRRKLLSVEEEEKDEQADTRMRLTLAMVVE
jgi:hypothetical protein